MISHAGQILDSATPYEHNRVFIEIMIYTGYVSSYFKTVSQAHSRYFTKSGVRFFRCGGINPCTDTPFLRTSGKGRCLCFRFLLLAPVTHKLINSWQTISFQKSFHALQSSARGLTLYIKIGFVNIKLFLIVRECRLRQLFSVR